MIQFFDTKTMLLNIWNKFKTLSTILAEIEV